MSRAFVKEDTNSWGDPGKRYSLPARTDPGFDEAAAEALLEAARDGDTGSAESATGYYWGEKRLRAARAASWPISQVTIARPWVPMGTCRLVRRTAT